MLFSNPVDVALQGITSFTNPAVAHSHIKSLCSSFPALKPEQRRFPRNGGYVLGILLTGTIPMTYMNKRYNIPVHIVLDGYPSQRPIVCVTPTANMAIAPNHPFVASNGRCDSLHYLASWTPARSNLVDLVSVLSREFGNRPPVHTKNAQPTAYQQQQPVAQPQMATSYNQLPNQPPNQIPPQTSFGYPQSNPYPPQQPSHASLLSQVQSKVKKELSFIYSDATQELATLKQDQQSLQNTNLQFNEFEEKSGQEKANLEQNIRILEEQVKKMSEKLNSPEEDQNKVAASEKVTPKDQWSRQLLESKAEVNAIENVIFSLTTAVGDEVLSFDDFQKHIRDLCKKQFYSIALIEKIKHERKRL
ncbi:hypothetical protein P9112_004558 [Eukaryota sp. TZLM1-RC]